MTAIAIAMKTNTLTKVVQEYLVYCAGDVSQKVSFTFQQFCNLNCNISQIFCFGTMCKVSYTQTYSSIYLKVLNGSNHVLS